MPENLNWRGLIRTTMDRISKHWCMLTFLSLRKPILAHPGASFFPKSEKNHAFFRACQLFYNLIGYNYIINKVKGLYYGTN